MRVPVAPAVAPRAILRHLSSPQQACPPHTEPLPLLLATWHPPQSFFVFLMTGHMCPSSIPLNCLSHSVFNSNKHYIHV
jgi:hypothetical protein